VSMAGCSILAGIAGAIAATTGVVVMVGPLAAKIPKDRHMLFIVDLWAHLAAYGSGLISGIVLCTVVVVRRIHADPPQHQRDAGQ
jgi:hypothetical protein